MSNQHQYQQQRWAHQADVPEPFCTMREAAEALNIPYYRIVRAAKAGTIPHHTLGSGGKKYLLISEVLAAIKTHARQVRHG